MMILDNEIDELKQKIHDWEWADKTPSNSEDGDILKAKLNQVKEDQQLFIEMLARIVKEYKYALDVQKKNGEQVMPRCEGYVDAMRFCYGVLMGREVLSENEETTSEVSNE